MTFQEFELENSPHSGEFIVGYNESTGEEIRIPVGNFSITGTPGVGVDIQYSANGSDSWHYPATDEDEYVRIRKGTEAWSVPFKIVGKDGEGGGGGFIDGVEYSQDAETWNAEYAAGDLYFRWVYSDETRSETIRFRGENGTNGQPGQPGQQGRNIELQTAGGYIQWRTVGTTVWNNLVALSAITGSPGQPGKNIELQVANFYIQWRLVGDTNWQNLIHISSLQGIQGNDGISAYQVWLQAGNTGTEADFLNSLKGENGEGLPAGGNEGDTLVIDHSGNRVWSSGARVIEVEGSGGELVYNIKEYAEKNIIIDTTEHDQINIHFDYGFAGMRNTQIVMFNASTVDKQFNLEVSESQQVQFKGLASLEGLNGLKQGKHIVLTLIPYHPENESDNIIVLTKVDFD